MLKKLTIVMVASAAALLTATSAGMAQTKLKWAHVYETSEPFHTSSVWAGAGVGKRTSGRYTIDVYPASQLGKETDINQGLALGSVDIIISGSSFAAKSYPPIGVTYYPLHFPRRRSSPGLHQERRLSKISPRAYEDKTGHRIVAVTYYGVRHTSSNRPIKVCADMKGLKIRVPDVPGLSRNAARLRRQHRADRVRRGLSGAAERNRGSPGKSAHHHRHRITDAGPATPPSPSTSRRSGDPGTSRWSWPTTSSRVRGRIRTASGLPASPRSSAAASNRSTAETVTTPSGATLFSARSGPTWDRGPVRILIVEDDHVVAGAVRRGLEREGFAVDVAADGTEGLWRATETSYDAVVLDIMLPGLSGYEVCARMRAADNWSPALTSWPATATSTRPARWTPAPTTTCPSRSRTSSCSHGCAPCCGAGSRSGPPSSWQGTCGWTRRPTACGAATPRPSHPAAVLLLEFLMRGVATCCPSPIASSTLGLRFDGDPNIVEF